MNQDIKDPQQSRFGFQLLRWLRIIWQIVLNAGVVLGVLTGYLAMIQRVSVSQATPLDPDDIFTTPFIVSNDGPLPMENVKFSCGIAGVKYEKGPLVMGDRETSFSNPTFDAPEINPGERVSLPCAFEDFLKPPIPMKISNADITIHAPFRIGYTPFSAIRTFRFVSFHSSDNRLLLYPQPLSQNPVK